MVKEKIIEGNPSVNISYGLHVEGNFVILEYADNSEGDRAHGTFSIKDYKEGILKLFATGDCRIKGEEGELWIHTDGIGALLRFGGGGGNRVAIINRELNLADLSIASK